MLFSLLVRCRKLTRGEGLVFLLVACGALFVGAQVMFELREQELRQGIMVKC